MGRGWRGEMNKKRNKKKKKKKKEKEKRRLPPIQGLCPWMHGPLVPDKLERGLDVGILHVQGRQYHVLRAILGIDVSLQALDQLEVSIKPFGE